MQVISGPKHADSKEEPYEYLMSFEDEGEFFDVCLWHGNDESTLGPSWCVRWGPNGDYSSGLTKMYLERISNGEFVDYMGTKERLNYLRHIKESRIDFMLIVALALTRQLEKPTT